MLRAEAGKLGEEVRNSRVSVWVSFKGRCYPKGLGGALRERAGARCERAGGTVGRNVKCHQRPRAGVAGWCAQCDWAGVRLCAGSGRGGFWGSCVTVAAITARCPFPGAVGA